MKSELLSHSPALALPLIALFLFVAVYVGVFLVTMHGSAPEKIFGTIANGVATKGMPAWQPQLGPLRTQAVAAYVIQLRGTNAPNGKPPQGERESLTLR